MELYAIYRLESAYQMPHVRDCLLYVLYRSFLDPRQFVIRRLADAILPSFAMGLRHNVQRMRILPMEHCVLPLELLAKPMHFVLVSLLRVHRMVCNPMAPFVVLDPEIAI